MRAGVEASNDVTNSELGDLYIHTENMRDGHGALETELQKQQQSRPAVAARIPAPIGFSFAASHKPRDRYSMNSNIKADDLGPEQ
ncbi:hypothetical protein D9M72_518360 [compost metagenome]